MEEIRCVARDCDGSVMEQAKTRVYIGAALFHLGKKTEAIAAVEAGVAKLTQVQEDAMIKPGLRESAGKVLSGAVLKTMRANEWLGPQIDAGTADHVQNVNTRLRGGPFFPSVTAIPSPR
jgi:hypothetical protein